MATPLVSIIIPYYNNEKTLARAIASVKAQTYQNWECLIVDDGSQSSPAAIIEEFNDPRIRLLLGGENRGRGYARQKGLDSAKGKYVCNLDADDWLFPEKVARQVEYLEYHSSAALVCSAIAVIDSDGRLIGVRRFGEGSFAAMATPDYLPIPHGPCLIRLDVAKEAGYDIHLRIVEDYDFLLKILLKYTYACLSEPLYASTESADLDLKRMMANQLATSEVLQKYRLQFPREVQKLTNKLSFKTFGYTALHAVGAYKYLFSWKTKRPRAEERFDFEKARSVVENLLGHGRPQ